MKEVKMIPVPNEKVETPIKGAMNGTLIKGAVQAKINNPIGINQAPQIP